MHIFITLWVNIKIFRKIHAVVSDKLLWTVMYTERLTWWFHPPLPNFVWARDEIRSWFVLNWNWCMILLSVEARSYLVFFNHVCFPENLHGVDMTCVFLLNKTNLLNNNTPISQNWKCIAYEIHHTWLIYINKYCV